MSAWHRHCRAAVGVWTVMAEIAARGVVIEPRRLTGVRPQWLRAHWSAYGLLLPSFIVLMLFTYGPVLQVVWDSLHLKRSLGAAPTFGGAQNFEAVFADAAFRKALVNNVIYAIGTVGPSLVIALGLALALGRSQRINNALRAVYFLPALIPLIAAASLFLFVFLPNVGLLDFYLGRILVQPPNWLGDPDVALYSIMVLTVWKNAGYYMLFFLAGLQAIPDDAYEAAYLEGATPWQRLRHITLPYLKPSIAFVGVIALLNVVTPGRPRVCAHKGRTPRTRPTCSCSTSTSRRLRVTTSARRPPRRSFRWGYWSPSPCCRSAHSNALSGGADERLAAPQQAWPPGNPP